MPGHHNLTIYTGQDAIICRKCHFGEFIRSAHVFDSESYMCWNRKALRGTKDKCSGYKVASDETMKIFKKLKVTISAAN